MQKQKMKCEKCSPSDVIRKEMSRNHLCLLICQKSKISEHAQKRFAFLTCSLKSLAKRLKLPVKCLWSDVKCLRSDPKVANFKPIVKTAPILKTNREIIISSTDQEPPRISLISWYAKKIPKITKRITAILSMYSIVLVSILTTNQPFNQPYNKKHEYYCNNNQHPVDWFLFHGTIDKSPQYINFSLENQEKTPKNNHFTTTKIPKCEWYPPPKCEWRKMSK